MNIQLSNRVQHVKPSPTLAVNAKAALLKKEGHNIISLGAGEPDFDTPQYIKAAAIDAIQKGFTKYTAVEGILELRKTISDKFLKENQLNYQPSQILVSCGGKQSFYNLAQALLNEEDEVIIPAPYWVSYPDMVLLASARPVFIFADISQQFKISPTQLEKAITPKTRLFVLNSPSNPTGIAYTADELLALGEVLRKYPNVLIATDDMYEKIFWGKEKFQNILNVCPDLYPRTLILNGVSKAYAMTGWRIGYAAGPDKVIEAMTTIQSQSTSNPCSISQMAAKAALEGDGLCIKQMINAFKERHDFIVKALNTFKGIECLPGDGAFYAFPKVQEIMNILKIKDDIEFAEFLLNEAKIAVVPGSAFGAPGYLRLSFATSLENLQEAIVRLEKVLKKIAH